MNISAMLRAFCDAVEQRNGAEFAELFTEDGVYHDVFYGAFAGRAKIAEMIDDWFYRTATDFRWDMHAQVSDGATLYARYTFSYRSTLPEAKGARAMLTPALKNSASTTRMRRPSRTSRVLTSIGARVGRRNMSTVSRAGTKSSAPWRCSITKASSPMTTRPCSDFGSHGPRAASVGI